MPHHQRNYLHQLNVERNSRHLRIFQSLDKGVDHHVGSKVYHPINESYSEFHPAFIKEEFQKLEELEQRIRKIAKNRTRDNQSLNQSYLQSHAEVL